MKMFLVAFAMLPVIAMGQTPESKSKTESLDLLLPTQQRINWQHRCGGPVYDHDRLRSVTIYVIDGVKVATAEPVVIEKVELRIDMNTPTTLVLQRKDMTTLPYTDLTDVEGLAPGMYQQQRGTVNTPTGGRSSEMLYVVDGMQIARW